MLEPLLFGALFVGGLALFGARALLWGMPRDRESIVRGGAMTFFRHYFFWLIQPIWRLLLWSRLPPVALTTLAAWLGIAAGFGAAAGRFGTAGVLFLCSGICDTLDGRLARAKNASSRVGAALDSVLDRYVDTALLFGLGWHYRSSWVLLPVFGALLGSSLVPYIRARGEGLGVSLTGGLMQRHARIILLGGGVAMSPLFDAWLMPENARSQHWLAIGCVLVVAVLSNVTALGRLHHLLTAVARAPPRLPLRQLLLNALAALVATGVDFCFALLLVFSLLVPTPLATAAGALLGAGVNYLLNRVVTFKSQGAVPVQLGRYAVVSGTSALLNAFGVALGGAFAGVDAMHGGYALAWCVVRVLVWALWNFPLQREYVFRSERQ